MAEKNIPRVKTLSDKVKYPVSRCGDNWWLDVRIRCPYKGTDTAYRTLPSLGSRGQVERFDRVLVEEMRMDISRVQAFVDSHRADIGSRQMSNIRTMLDRAAAYILDADTIFDTWAAGFDTESGQSVPPAPLGSRRASGRAAAGLAKDEAKWQGLVSAAARNLRCAEEVAKRATIRARNRSRHSQARVFAGLGDLAPSATKSGKVASGIRKDKLGQKAWRIWRDGDKYLAQIMISSSQWSGVQEEVGSAASANGARSLLRDRFNSELLSKFPNEKPKIDPHDVFKIESIYKKGINTQSLEPSLIPAEKEIVQGLDISEDSVYPEVDLGDIDLESEAIVSSPEPSPGPPPSPTPSSTPAPPPKTKTPKKGGGMMIIGAAAIGLLLISKKG